jgi:hypothetical protein
MKEMVVLTVCVNGICTTLSDYMLYVDPLLLNLMMWLLEPAQQSTKRQEAVHNDIKQAFDHILQGQFQI